MYKILAFGFLRTNFNKTHCWFFYINFLRFYSNKAGFMILEWKIYGILTKDIFLVTSVNTHNFIAQTYKYLQKKHVKPNYGTLTWCWMKQLSAANKEMRPKHCTHVWKNNKTKVLTYLSRNLPFCCTWVIPYVIVAYSFFDWVISNLVDRWIKVRWKPGYICYFMWESSQYSGHLSVTSYDITSYDRV